MRAFQEFLTYMLPHFGGKHPTRLKGSVCSTLELLALIPKIAPLKFLFHRTTVFELPRSLQLPSKHKTIENCLFTMDCKHNKM